jgi:chromosome segregation ATPase
MSKAHEAQARIALEEKRKLDAKRAKEVEEARRRAAMAAEAARKQREATLKELKQQSVQLSDQKANLNAVAELNQQLGSSLREKINRIAKSEVEARELGEAIQSSKSKLNRLADQERKIQGSIKELITDLAASEEEANNHLKQWGEEILRSELNQNEVKVTLEDGDMLRDDIVRLIHKSNEFTTHIGQQEKSLASSIKKLNEIDDAAREVDLKLEFIDSNETLSTAAFCTLKSLEGKDYKLREVISDNELTAWFEHVDEHGNLKEILVKLTQDQQDANGWLEELDLTKGFEGEDCLDEQDAIIYELKKLGVEYSIKSQSPYPIRPGAVEQPWKKKLQNTRSTNRHKRKN